jgi:hypothetical protein
MFKELEMMLVHEVARVRNLLKGQKDSKNCWELVVLENYVGYAAETYVGNLNKLLQNMRSEQALFEQNPNANANKGYFELFILLPKSGYVVPERSEDNGKPS